MQHDSTALVSCMRNEGLFVLEWVAYHQTIGFDDIVIVTNACTDGSDTLLEALADHGVTHIRQDLAPGASPQDAGMDLALAHLRAKNTNWCLHIDSDEFLLIETGDGMLHDLLPPLQAADVVPINWRNFGDNGLRDWTPGACVLEHFTKAEAGPTPGTTKSKCFFRVNSFARATDHNPLDAQIANPIVLSADAEPLSNASLKQRKSSRFRPHDVACRAKNARLNHYAVKSQDLFLMKNDRGDGQGKTGEPKYHLGSSWHRSANTNDVEDRAILRHMPAVQRHLKDLRHIPAIAQAEQHCQDWFVQRRSQILTPAQRKRWTKGRGS